MTPEAQRDRARLLVWWVVWAATLASLALAWLVLGRRPLPPNPDPAQSLTGLAGLVPLFVSIVLRWLVLPRYEDLRRAFVVYVIGVALADACGLLGFFCGGPYRDDLFLLGALGVAQFVPFFARQYLEPRVRGYRPNH